MGVYRNLSAIVLATRNPAKIREIVDILADRGIDTSRFKPIRDFPDVAEAPEDGETFKENAVRKANHAASSTGCLALADDSGLEVDALGGLPGIRSARFAGNGATDMDNNRKLLALLKDVPKGKRTARFRCVAAIASPEGKVETFEGTCEGVIGFEPKGEGGFGYDPLFIVPEYGLTFAELGEDIKNRISHRARALIRLVESWRQGGTNTVLTE